MIQVETTPQTPLITSAITPSIGIPISPRPDVQTQDTALLWERSDRRQDGDQRQRASQMDWEGKQLGRPCRDGWSVPVLAPLALAVYSVSTP